MVSSNFWFLLFAALALGAGAACFFVESSWMAAVLAMISIACVLTFIMLSIARLQRPDETPAQTTQRLADTAGKFDQDP